MTRFGPGFGKESWLAKNPIDNSVFPGDGIREVSLESYLYTPAKFNIPCRFAFEKRKVVPQPACFRGNVNLPGCVNIYIYIVVFRWFLLLMEEIFHRLIWQISHYVQGFICMFPSINSIYCRILYWVGGRVVWIYFVILVVYGLYHPIRSIYTQPMGTLVVQHIEVFLLVIHGFLQISAPYRKEVADTTVSGVIGFSSFLMWLFV